MYKLFNELLYLKSNTLNQSRGFTLVELIVVIGIMGILASIALLTIDPVGQLQKARDAKRKAEVNIVQAALEFYKTDVGNYPDAATYSSISCGDPFTNGSVTYIREMPCDPTTHTLYEYSPSGSPANQYSLYACLERTDDKDIHPTDTTCSPLGTFRVVNP